MSADLPPGAPPGSEGDPSGARTPLRVEVFTIFPDLVRGYTGASILGRAQRRGLLDVRVHDLRAGADDPHRSVDDAPFGGGGGMVLAPGPVFAAVEAADPVRPLLLTDPGGRPFTQEVAGELAGLGGFSLLCGRYEGVDERIRAHLVDGEVSIGDVVLAGGELAALVVVEAVARLVPGVLGNATSSVLDSFATGLLEAPHYTRPAVFRGWEVPPVLRSGDHGAVARWRHEQSLLRTARLRPDLLEDYPLGEADRALLAEAGIPAYDVTSPCRRPGVSSPCSPPT